jgi:hypothetical protein
MEKVLGFPKNEDDDEAVIILMDPDMILTRPMTRYFNKTVDRWCEGDTRDIPKNNNKEDYYWKVDRGRPVAQKYTLANEWTRWGTTLSDLVGTDSPALRVSPKEALDHYQLGPPYLATARDMYNIVAKWADIVRDVHKAWRTLTQQHEEMLADMIAFVIAAAHLQLPHQMSQSFMWSDPRIAYEEPWDWVESLPKERLCDGTILQDGGMMANVFHYCQIYSFRDYTFYKLDLRGKIFKCNHPLLVEPKFLTDADTFDWTTEHWNLQYRLPENKQKWAERTNQREAFMTCQLIYRVNEAMEHHRLHTCHAHRNQQQAGGGAKKSDVNVEKTFRMDNPMLQTADK